MPKVTYVQPSGESITIELNEGMTVMQGAINNDVKGIDAECGGTCSCGTCHCYIDEQWSAVVAAPGEHETEMLDCVANLKPSSRLSCQIVVNKNLDGLIVHLPNSQGY